MITKKILIVDDSALMRRIACDIIAEDGRYEVKDMAKNGQEALELLKKNSYDAVILDVNMPRMNGLELLKALQEARIHVRVMMFSTQTGEGTRETIEALEMGAIDFIQKPEGMIGKVDDKFKKKFLDILSAVAKAYGSSSHFMSSMEQSSRDAAAVTKRAAQNTSAVLSHLQQMNKSTPIDVKLRPAEKVSGSKCLAIASSTGGPRALQTLIPMLPGNLNAPVVLVQHMPAGFTKSLAERLNQLSALSVKEAEEGDKLEKGHVYIAPGGRHMKIGRSGSGYRIYFGDEPTREGVRPCANYMYESLADSDFAQICCVVLTGMGADGTEGIKNLAAAKKLHIIAQSEETCAVYGMPKAIAATGLVNEIRPLTDIAASIVANVGTL